MTVQPGSINGENRFNKAIHSGFQACRTLAQDLPGHGDGTAAVDDANRQDGKDVSHAGGIQRHSQPRRRPTLENPSQQRSEAGGDLELATMVAVGFGLSRLVELLKAGSDCRELESQEGDQGGGDTVESAPLS